MPQSWQELLSQTRTETDVVKVGKDFIAQFSPDEIEALPEICRPPRRLRDASDITEYAFSLVRHRCDSAEQHGDAAYRLTNFFSNAAVRLSHILHELALSKNADLQRKSA